MLKANPNIARFLIDDFNPLIPSINPNKHINKGRGNTNRPSNNKIPVTPTSTCLGIIIIQIIKSYKKVIIPKIKELLALLSLFKLD